MSNWQKIDFNGQICTAQVTQHEQTVQATIDLLDWSRGGFTQVVIKFPLTYWQNCTATGAIPSSAMAL